MRCVYLWAEQVGFFLRGYAPESEVGMNAKPKRVVSSTVPLGVLLSEKCPKVPVSEATPSTAYWTGGPDSQLPDADD